MRKEGNIVNRPKEDKIIARFEKNIPMGSRVYDNRRQLIGEVIGIFGPIEKPFIEIKKEQRDSKIFISPNKKIYVEEE